VKSELKEPLAGAAGEELLIAFIESVIEFRGLIYGGGLESGFVCKAGRGCATEEDRSAVQQWLQARSEFTSVTVQELTDAWYGSLTAN
jgi:uncharacterized protein YggL (DUF469 family)